MITIREATHGPALLRLAALALVLAAVLAAAWFLIDALQGSSVEQTASQAPALNAPASIAARPVGMGDVRRYEGQLALQSRPVGMGDVRRYEGQLAQQIRRVGMGDVRLFESTQR